MAINDDAPANDMTTNEMTNPWGKPPSNNQSPWGNKGGNKGGNNGSGGQGGPHDDMPDLGEIMKKMKDNFGGPFGLDGRGILLGLLVAVVLWLGSGIFRVQPNENAVILRFGAHVKTQTQAGLGYHWPFPIESVTKLNVTLDRRVQIGFNDTGRTHAAKRDIAEESLMLTADANIVDIDVVVLWNITEAEKFLFKIRDQELTIKSVAESVIREVVGQTKLQTIITEGRNDVAARIKATMQEILDSYESGVSVNEVLIQEATVHPEVLEAYNDVAAARQDAERFQNEATIYRNDIIPKARGQAIKMAQDAEAYKQDVIARSSGDAKRFTETLAAYKTGKDVTRDRIYIETMELVMSQANRMVIDQEAGGGILPYLALDGLKRNDTTNNQLNLSR